LECFLDDLAASDSPYCILIDATEDVGGNLRRYSLNMQILASRAAPEPLAAGKIEDGAYIRRGNSLAFTARSPSVSMR
jgi:hypothetical protein